jgi:site-specific recombinase XerD
LNLNEKVVHILKSSCSNGTWKQYESSLKKWIEYCTTNNLNVYESRIENYLSFLASLFESGLGYNSINTARSALSSVFPLIENSKIGEHRLISQFMKGVSKLRPPRPKYSITWDTNSMLELLKSWDCNIIDLKTITLKLIALLALVTAQRAQTLTSIKISDIVWGSPVQIKLSSILKTTSIKNPNPVLVIPSFDSTNLCPVHTLHCYIDKTKDIRKESDQLFISFVPPHKPVTSQTISHWLCKVLEMSNIDTSVFSGHSFRHASTSKASNRGVSIDSIFQRAGWSSGSKVFAKHYNKRIDDRSNFANVLLNE